MLYILAFLNFEIRQKVRIFEHIENMGFHENFEFSHGIRAIKRTKNRAYNHKILKFAFYIFGLTRSKKVSEWPDIIETLLTPLPAFFKIRYLNQSQNKSWLKI